MAIKPFHATKKYIASALLAFSLVVAAPHSAQAANKIEDDAHYDGRVQGYEPVDVELPASSAGMNWFLVLALAAVSLGVIFKDAKRSHLD